MDSEEDRKWPKIYYRRRKSCTENDILMEQLIQQAFSGCKINRRYKLTGESMGVEKWGKAETKKEGKSQVRECVGNETREEVGKLGGNEVRRRESRKGR